MARLQSLLGPDSKTTIQLVTQEKSVSDIDQTSKTSADTASVALPNDQQSNTGSPEWSTSEDWLLRMSWGIVSMESIEHMLNRDVHQLHARIVQFRSLLKMGPWDANEHQLLRKLYNTRSTTDLEITLLRSAPEIVAEAKSLRIKKRGGSISPPAVANELRAGKQRSESKRSKVSRRAKMPRWSQQEVQRLILLYEDHDNAAISRDLGRSVTSVANKAWQLGITKSVEQLAKIGRTNVI